MAKRTQALFAKNEYKNLLKDIKCCWIILISQVQNEVMALIPSSYSAVWGKAQLQYFASKQKQGRV